MHAPAEAAKSSSNAAAAKPDEDQLPDFAASLVSTSPSTPTKNEWRPRGNAARIPGVPIRPDRLRSLYRPDLPWSLLGMGLDLTR